MKEEKLLGLNVKIKFKKSSPFGEVEEIYHNVTEIHYLYPTLLEDKKVAFESDIHGNGITHNVDYIKEFEAIVAIKKEKLF